MEIAFASKNDLPQVMRLWKDCFFDTDDYMNLYFKNLYSAQNTLLLKEGDRILAMLQILPFAFYSGSDALCGGYISGACTDAEFRNRGLMCDLLTESFCVMRERNMAFSALIPAVSGFYEKFGYEFAFDLSKKTHLVQSFLVGNGTEVFACNLSHMKNEYVRHAQKFALAHIRSDAWWECIEKLYVLPENCGAIGCCGGYVVYEIKADTLYLRESFYDTKEEFDAMVTVLLSKYRDVKTVKQTVALPGKPFAMIKWLTPEKKVTGAGYLNLMLN